MGARSEFLERGFEAFDALLVSRPYSTQFKTPFMDKTCDADIYCSHNTRGMPPGGWDAQRGCQ